MRNKLIFFLALSCIFQHNLVKAQAGNETYIWPKDAKVLDNLKKWL